MLPSSPKKTTAVGDDCVRPTAYQVQSGHIVVPRKFYENHAGELDWKRSFSAVVFGERLENKKVDYDRRLNIRLKDKISPGDVLRLAIAENALVIEKA